MRTIPHVPGISPSWSLFSKDFQFGEMNWHSQIIQKNEKTMGKVGRSMGDWACNNELEGYEPEFGVPEQEAQCFNRAQWWGENNPLPSGVERESSFPCVSFPMSSLQPLPYHHLPIHSTSIYYVLSIVLGTSYTFFHSTFPEALWKWNYCFTWPLGNWRQGMLRSHS